VPSSNIKVIESILALTQDNRKSPLEEGNFVHIPELSRQNLNDDKGIVSDPIADDEVTLRPVSISLFHSPVAN
jgi:hypothetical protein